MIEWIESADDPRLDPYRHVADPRWVREHDLFVAEGRLVVERLLSLGRFAVQSILVNRAAHDAMGETLTAERAPVLVCADPTLLTAITGYDFHRGCLALVARPPQLAPETLVSGRRVLALEGVGNPDNIGGLFRTAAAFGVDGVLLDRTSGDPLYRKAIRTSMGAVLRLPYVRIDDWLEGLDRFRRRGMKLIALTPRLDAVPLEDFAREPGAGDRIVLLVGAEGPGLASATLAHADARVRIPTTTGVDSLNVVVASGIAIHALSRSAL